MSCNRKFQSVEERREASVAEQRPPSTKQRSPVIELGFLGLQKQTNKNYMKKGMKNGKEMNTTACCSTRCHLFAVIWAVFKSKYTETNEDFQEEHPYSLHCVLAPLICLYRETEEIKKGECLSHKKHKL